MMLVEINPADVVSIPTDCQFQKLRTCKYKVVGEYEIDLNDPVYASRFQTDQDDDVEHLTYLLRQMFRNSGLSDVRVTAHKNDDILVEVYMNKKETLRNVIKVFEVANKLKRDILAQYDSEFEMWESKDKRGILTFGFTLDEGLDDDNMPF